MKVTSIHGRNFEIQVGSELFVPCRGRGGHGAWMTVTKVNRATVKAIEDKGSYTPGTPWTVHKNSEFAIVERPEGKAWHRHWIADSNMLITP